MINLAEKQYVIFELDEREFGIDIMNVKEIITYEEITPIPDGPSFSEGVINHRGTVIPIINLRKRFSLEDSEVTKETRIIVVGLDGKEIGFLVDEASQTIRLKDDQIDSPPLSVGEIDKRYMVGLGKIDEKRLLIIIDLEKVLSEEEVREIEEEVKEIEKNA